MELVKKACLQPGNTSIRPSLRPERGLGKEIRSPLILRYVVGGSPDPLPCTSGGELVGGGSGPHPAGSKNWEKFSSGGAHRKMGKNAPFSSFLHILHVLLF